MASKPALKGSGSKLAEKGKIGDKTGIRLWKPCSGMWKIRKKEETLEKWKEVMEVRVLRISTGYGNICGSVGRDRKEGETELLGKRLQQCKNLIIWAPYRWSRKTKKDLSHSV